MGRFLNTFFLCLITFQQVKSQSFLIKEPDKFIAEYKLIYQPDSTENKTNIDTQLLFIGQTISKFETKSFYMRDSLICSSPDLTQDNAQVFVNKIVSLTRVTADYIFYKKRPNFDLYCYDMIGTNLYTYSEPKNLFVWNISTTTREIAGYVCQKATTTFAGRNFEAWFTKDIPIPGGPYKFYGLPGLILMVYDTRRHYTYEITNIKKTRVDMVIALPMKNAQLTTKQELRKGKISYAANSIERLSSMGNNFTDADKRSFQERVKKRNNSLELK